MAIKTVEWIRKIRDENYEKTKDMSFEQRKAYIESKAGAGKTRGSNHAGEVQPRL